MAISLASLKQTTSLTPPRILIHGVAGVGKTTFAAKSDRPVIIATEEGLGTLADARRQAGRGRAPAHPKGRQTPTTGTRSYAVSLSSQIQGPPDRSERALLTHSAPTSGV